MRVLKAAFGIVFLTWVFILNGCGGGSGGGVPSAPVPSPTPSGAAPVVTAFSINGSAGVIPGNKIAVTLPYGTNVTALTATFTAPGSVVTVGGIPQISGVTTNNFTQPVVYTITRIGTGTSASAKASASNVITYTVTITVASISAKTITAFSLGTPPSASVTPGIISILNVAVTVPFGTNVKSLIATFTTSGQNVTVNGVAQASGTTPNDFTNPVTYTVTAADGSSQNYTVTVAVASASANDIISFSLNGTPGVISSGGLSQTIMVTVPNGTNINGLVASFITTGTSVAVDGTAQVSGSTQNDFTNPVTYIVTSANGIVQTYTVTVTVASASSSFINAYSFGNVTGVISGQNITVTVPNGTGVTALIATFTTTGVNVTVGGATQTSTVTPNDFTNPVTYTVTAADGSTSTYTVTVSVVPSSAKAITTFAFGTTAGVITGQSIAVNMPFGTDVTGLIATFTTTGVKVAVNGVTQFSGTTTNDFTNPVTYVVTAADGTTQIYTVTINFTNNLWTWVSGTNAFLPRGTYGTKGIGSVNNIPGGRVESILQLISNNVWLFGGNGYGTSASAGNINDLWQYNPSNNQWTWMGGPNIINQRGTYGTQGTGSTSNIPGARSIGVSWADSSGNFWLFGGSGFGVSGPPGRLNDLWKYSTSGASAGQWTWVSGSNTTNAFAVYGSQGTGSSSNTPGARLGAISWTDSNGNFWLFGGDGFVASGGAGSLNDLWKYTPSNNQWTWVSGTNLTNQLGIYGTQGIASPGNMPGGRKLSQHWVDSSGNLWLFGGFGFGASGGSSFLNDLWKYTPSTNAWTWVGGTNLLNQVGIYGTQGIGSTSNIPGARYEGMSWVDSSGNFWLFGGLAVASTIPLNDDVINDLWIYAPSTNKWTWVSGANVISQIGNYGTLGVGATTNVPGARQASSVGWTDGVGNLWVFGGAGYGTSSLTQSLNDLWQYHY